MDRFSFLSPLYPLLADSTALGCRQEMRWQGSRGQWWLWAQRLIQVVSEGMDMTVWMVCLWVVGVWVGFFIGRIYDLLQMPLKK